MSTKPKPELVGLRTSRERMERLVAILVERLLEFLPPIRNEEDHRIAVIRIEQLAGPDPAPDTPEGVELMLLATQVEAYEKEKFKI